MLVEKTDRLVCVGFAFSKELNKGFQLFSQKSFFTTLNVFSTPLVL